MEANASVSEKIGVELLNSCVSGLKGVAMSAGSRKDEIYVGFLLILLAFLYLSHLTDQMKNTQKVNHAETKKQELEHG